MRQETDLRRLGLRVHPERVILYYIYGHRWMGMEQFLVNGY